MRELFTFKGETDGISTSGDCPLYSDLIYIGSPPFVAPTYIVIPFGLKAKIWAKRIGGNAATTFTISYTKDVTVASPVWNAVDIEVLSSAGEISLEKRRPLALRSLTGKEAFKISWSQTTAAKAYIDIEVEFTDEDA